MGGVPVVRLVRAVRVVLLVLAAASLGAAGSGAADTFYISPTSDALARAASGDRQIAVSAVVLLALSAALALARLPLSCLATAVAGAVFLAVAQHDDETVLTYLMVPVAAVLLLVTAPLDLRHLQRHGR